MVYIRLTNSMMVILEAGNCLDTMQHDFSVGPCVTSITRTEPEKEFARIIQVDEAACPFSKVVADDTIWKIVADCLYNSGRAR